MGLDTTHDCWHGPYPAFSRWRNDVAMAAGYAVGNLVMGSGFAQPTVMIDWGHLGTETHLMGIWDKTPDDPLLVLIVHYDHTGEIYPAQQLALAWRLENIAEKLNSGNKEKTLRFAKGLREAHSRGESVRFH